MDGGTRLAAEERWIGTLRMARKAPGLKRVEPRGLQSVQVVGPRLALMKELVLALAQSCLGQADDRQPVGGVLCELLFGHWAS